MGLSWGASLQSRKSRVQGSGYRGDGSGQGYIIGWGVMPYRTHRPDFQGVGFRADPESKSYTSHTFRLEGSGETRLNVLKLQGAWFYSGDYAEPAAPDI